MRIFNRSSYSPQKDKLRQLTGVLGDSPGLSKPYGLTRYLSSAFIFLLTCSLLLSTLTISQAIEAHFCVKWYPTYGGPAACAGDGATVGGKMWVKMVVSWLGTEDVGGVLDGSIEVEENAGHPGQYMKWYPQQQTPACVPCTPPRGYQARILSQLQAEGDWYLYIPHNGPWTIRGGYKTWPPPEGIPGPPPTPITITLRNLTVQNVTPEYLFWDPDNPPEPSKRTITYSLDSVQQTPVNVTIKIFPLSTVETPDPIKTIQESRTSPGGPYEYTWDGSTTQGPSAPKGIYPFEIEVAQPQPTDPQDQKTSKFLTISGVSASSVESNAGTKEKKIKLDYTLSDTGNKSATELKIRVYDPDLTLAKEYDLSGNSEALTPGSHTVYFTLVMEKGEWRFIVLAKDDHASEEKAHRKKPASEKGTTIAIPPADNYDEIDGTSSHWGPGFQENLIDGTYYTAYDHGQGNTVASACDRLEKDAIFYFYGHGDYGRVSFADGLLAAKRTGDPAKDGTMKGFICDLNLKSVLLAVWAACGSADDDPLGFGNIMEQTWDQGADVSVGFHEYGPYYGGDPNDVHYEWAYWLWQALCQGSTYGNPDTVQEALVYARDMIGNKYGTENDYWGCGLFRTNGNASLSVVPARHGSP